MLPLDVRYADLLNAYENDSKATESIHKCINSIIEYAADIAKFQLQIPYYKKIYRDSPVELDFYLNFVKEDIALHQDYIVNEFNLLNWYSENAHLVQFYVGGTNLVNANRFAEYVLKFFYREGTDINNPYSGMKEGIEATEKKLKYCIASKHKADDERER